MIETYKVRSGIYDTSVTPEMSMLLVVMDMYRRMLRISWTKHRTNNSIFEELEPARRFLAEVRRRKLQYVGHVVRADNLCTHVLHGIVDGKRRRGRPRRRWTDDIKQWTGISVAECVQHAKDRSRGEPWCPCRCQ